jgi:hypothetical protein
MEEIKMKYCKRCNQEKPVSEFNRQARRKDGLQFYCKECQHGMNHKGYHNRKKAEVKRTIISVDEKNLVKVYAHPELAKFTPRQLMEELKSRGFTWTSMYEPRREIKFEKI